MAVLVIEKGRNKGQRIYLEEGRKIVVGRDKACDLVIDDMMASRKHFQVEMRHGRVLIRDLGSSNGTYVNGKKITAQTLEHNFQIQVGDSLLSLLDEKAIDLTQTAEFHEGLIAGYRLLDRIGRGGMGTVYLAEQMSLKRKVALKILSKEFVVNQNFVSLFIEEARATGRLNHPHIIAVYEVGQVGETYYFSMEYMPKGTVEDLVNEKGILPLEDSLSIIYQAARGLEYAEKKRIIHRDIKPANLMLGENLLVKIGDLGIAKMLKEQENQMELDCISGSPHYIAPEHALGKPIDHRVDIYSLGVTFYQLLTGRTPFRGKSPKEIIFKHIEENPEKIEQINSQVPPRVCEIVEKMMEKEPEERFQSAREVIMALDELRSPNPIEIDSSPVSTPPSTPSESTPLEKETDSRPSLSPSLTSFHKNMASLFLILLFILLSVHLINQVLDYREEKRWKEKLQTLSIAYRQGDLKKAEDLAQEMIKKAKRDEFRMKGKMYLEKIHNKRLLLAEEARKKREEEARQVLNSLQKNWNQLRNLEEARNLLPKVQNFLLIYNNTRAHSDGKDLFQKIETYIQQKEEERKRAVLFKKEAKRAFEKILNKVSVLLDRKKYGDCWYEVRQYPGIYKNTVYGQKLKILEKKFQSLAEKWFQNYLENHSLTQAALKIKEDLKKENFLILKGNLQKFPSRYVLAKNEILDTAKEMKIPHLQKLAEAYLARIYKEYKKISEKLYTYMTQKEDKMVSYQLERAKKLIHDFYLKDARLRLSSILKKTGIERNRQRLSYHILGIQSLEKLKKKLIEYINQYSRLSKIYLFSKKYPSILQGVAIKADQLQIVFENFGKKTREYIFWRDIPPLKLFQYLLVLERKGLLEGEDYIGLVYFAYLHGLKNEGSLYASRGISIAEQKGLDKTKIKAMIYFLKKL